MRRGRTVATGGAAFASCRTGGVSNARSPLSTRGGSTTLETGICTLRIRRRPPHGISRASRTSLGDRRTRCRAFSYVSWVGTNHLTASGFPCTEDPVRASVRVEHRRLGLGGSAVRLARPANRARTHHARQRVQRSSKSSRPLTGRAPRSRPGRATGLAGSFWLVDHPHRSRSWRSPRLGGLAPNAFATRSR